MPVVYRCRGCGYILYAIERVGNPYGVKTPSEVISMYGGVCPKCGRRLEKPGLKDVEIVYHGPRSCGCEGGKSGKSVTVSVKLPSWMVEKLDALSRAKKVSRGELIRRALSMLLSRLS